MTKPLALLLFTGISLSSFAQLQKVDKQNFVKANDLLVTKASPIAENIPVKITNDNKLINEKIWFASKATPTVTLSNIETKVVENTSLDTSVHLASTFTPQVFSGVEQKKPMAFVQIPKYIKNQVGQIVQLTHYTLNTTEGTAQHKDRGARVYASNSVLATGNWYKIAVSNTGIVKINTDFVKTNLGVDITTINPNNIRVYGNGGAMLAENNATPRPDDLVENAIEVTGASDGKFDGADYFLFYAQGANAVFKDSANKAFTHQMNLYNDVAYYFINFDLGAGKRISTSNVQPTANVTVTTFNDFQYYEKDSLNLGAFGKLWWGDAFANAPGYATTRDYTFTFPNIDASSPITLQTQLGSISSNSGCSYQVLQNGVLSQSLYNYGAIAGDYPDVIASQSSTSSIANPTVSNTISIVYRPVSTYDRGYMNYIELNARRKLIQTTGVMPFRDWNSVAVGNVANFQLQASTPITVWDVTNAANPIAISTNANGNTYSFARDASTLHEYISHDGTGFNTATFVEKVTNQNLHGSAFADYIIVSHPNFIDEANKLALHHQTKSGLKTLVVTPQQIYNEFASGSQDISAIRDFVKMLYDKASNASDMPKYLLLFGDASYDYKKRLDQMENFVPTVETVESIRRYTGYCSDDFYGILDDDEDINQQIVNTLDIGVGRIVCKTLDEAHAVVNKIETYESPSSFGAWKNTMTFCGGNNSSTDGSYPIHAQDADDMSKSIADSQKVYNIFKIFVDAYPFTSTPAGARCPDASEALNTQISNGTFLVNFNGHGSTKALCDVRLFKVEDIPNYTNLNKLPLYVTATCDFAPFDNPAYTSAGEQLQLYPKGGAIALMTTTQLVFANLNHIMNINYMQKGFNKTNNVLPTLGDAFRLSKNLQYINALSTDEMANYRKFALLGDPALQLAFPTYGMQADSINGHAISAHTDTLKALNKCTITGHVTDANGALLSSFNGTANITIFDKIKTQSTLGQRSVNVLNYQIQNSVVFKGNATVSNGKFSITFIVPKDIDYSYGNSKISMYASNDNYDASGVDENIIIGGMGNSTLTDTKAPVVKAFINNNKFVNGGITTPNTALYVELSDENGINTTGSSIGHDIIAVLDNDTKNPITLNNYYEGKKDDYTSGTIKYPYKGLAQGKHTISVKAWDIFNNSGTSAVDFIVTDATNAQLDRVYNYPNPFTTSTKFMFEHNHAGETLYVTIQIYTVGGKLVKTIQQTILSDGNRVGIDASNSTNELSWDGKDQYGDKIGRGVYIYKLSYKTSTGISTAKYQKLVIL